MITVRLPTDPYRCYTDRRSRCTETAAICADRLHREPGLVDFALQGGGSHGAFTWGVLDRMLEEPWLRIDGISGTSAGAMNAVVLADGYINGEPRARAALEEFWRRVANAALLSPLRRGPLDVLMGRWTLNNSPAYIAMDLIARLIFRHGMYIAECISHQRAGGRLTRLRRASSVSTSSMQRPGSSRSGR
jgi:Patatin-like phospholipase